MIRVSSFGEIRDPYCLELIGRLRKLIPFDWKEMKIRKCPDKRPAQLLPEEEKFLSQNPQFFILDLQGKMLNDEEFYRFCFSRSDIHLVVGPAIGFHSEFFKKAQGSISLSPLTLTHGLAQTVLAESLYRVACTLKNHPFVK